ncbi:hypothetical protein [Helicobacter enhydrae]|uniref:hypothetical protein n=1 Tax=Helicobacter enhydrae TaxID=222136 RepID=UPI000A079F21|nr:hypothetical protein [Helicobacter enhydrae]
MDFEHLSKYKFANTDEERFFTDKDKKTEKIVFARTSCGIQRLKHFSKVVVSPLGEVKEAKPSKRQGMQTKKSSKNV